MGLPGFFAWLLKNYKSKILLKKIDGQVDNFYIDSNCLFHPECMKIKEYFTNLEVNELEEKMCDRIKNYLTFLYDFVNASKIVGTMVDGVCPLAKMSQQRKRRFKAIDDTRIRNDLKKKHGKLVNEKWSNTVITPGTEFMEKLHLKLLEFFKKIKTKGVTHVYSSYHTPGEGEHSILQHIKQNTKETDTVVIYGLDADLIFLAMTSGIENIYLLRESLHFGIKTEQDDLYDPVEDVAQELMYVSIKEVKIAFNNQLLNLAHQREDINFSFPENTDFSNDLVVICFLLGNDFLPHFPSIDIYKGGLDNIIDAYIETIAETRNLLTNLENGILKINQVVFNFLCKKLGDKEENFFRNGLPYYENIKNKRRCMALDDYSKELWRLENLKIFKIDDPICLGHGSPDEWKFRYYEHYFGVVEHQQEFIEELVKLYLEGIMWVGKYYFESCPAWKWHYPYDHGPFISDISDYLLRTGTNINDIVFKLDEPIEPMTQLLAVLPPASNNLIANSYKKYVTSENSPIVDMYPIKTQLDMLYKDQFWQCIPKLPTIDIDRIIQATYKEKLNKDEQIRNTVLGNFVFKK